jgi:hypothetical protein
MASEISFNDLAWFLPSTYGRDAPILWENLKLFRMVMSGAQSRVLMDKAFSMVRVARMRYA